jgi:hypothetical protein
MKRGWIVTLLLLALFAGAAAQAQKVQLGIAPVFDGGGEEFGPVVAQHLTLFMYQDLLKSSAVHPTLLSPGGVYSPLDTSWLVDYVHDRREIGLLLVPTLKPVPAHGKDHWSIPVYLELLDASSGDSLATWTISVDISSGKTILEYGQAIVGQGNINRLGQEREKYIGAPSRDFEKQPLGKATAHLAASARETLEAKLASLSQAKAPSHEGPVSETIPPGAAAPCHVHLRITYGYKHSASHSYELLVNGLDQSTNLADGIASFAAPEGELLIQFAVNDAPYKLQKESMYQLSTRHSCAASNLIVDIGPGGDAHPHWE